MSNVIPIQKQFRQELPRVIGNIDYQEIKNILLRISEFIEKTDIEFSVMKYAIQHEELNSERKLSDKTVLRIQERARSALRYAIARKIVDEPYREFSAHLADSALLQNFCLLNEFGAPISVPSKSSLERYEKMIPESVICDLIHQINLKASTSSAVEKLNLEHPISLADYYGDSTCLKINIHYPVDWVLLRDATRTLVLAIKWIRKYGIVNRMQNPEQFMNEMNKLCMSMTHCRRKKGGKKERKRVLRIMKKLVKRVKAHAEKHKELLEDKWKEAGIKEGYVKQTLKKIDNVLSQLPKAEKQAHERIIGERKVKAEDKTLSLYEHDTQIIVRGKAGAQVEFGNELYIAEQANGLIVDWELYKDQAPSGYRILESSLERISENYDGFKPKQATLDRAFDSKKTTKLLNERGIQNNVCPRSVVTLQKKQTLEIFSRNQKRRAQTEGRISILKKCFLDSAVSSKGFKSRKQSVAWSILAHNLWVLARLPDARDVRLEKAA